MNMISNFTILFNKAVECLSHEIHFIRLLINKTFHDWDSTEIIVVTFGLTVFLCALYNFIFQEEFTLWERLKWFFFRVVRRIPPIKHYIAKEKGKAIEEIKKDFNKHIKTSMGYVTTLPEQGSTQEKVLSMAREYKSIVHIDYKSGNVSGTVYNGSESLTRLNKEMYGEFAWSNPLHMDVFADVRKMEAEVVRMCCNLFHGGPESCGTSTSGGTESILMACKAYRELAMERGIRFPVILAPTTAHAAFNKAAHYFRMRLQHVPIDKVTGQVDVRKMRRAINSRTCMLVGSVPGFPHGIIDPIAEIAELGRKYNIPVHVDACLGGFLLPFMERAGFHDIPVCDFRLPGVTSISCDTHKYAFTPKGTSVILYSNKEFRQRQFFVAEDWVGGIYASPTMPGSRPGALIASCWGTLMHFGQEGYIDSTRRIITTARRIRDGLKKVEGIHVIGNPLMSVVAVASNHFSIFRLADLLSLNGWNLNLLQYPNSFHLCCTLLHTQEGVAERFLDHVSIGARKLMENPNAKDDGVGVIYGMAQSVPDRKLVCEITAGFLDVSFSTDM